MTNEAPKTKTAAPSGQVESIKEEFGKCCERCCFSEKDSLWCERPDDIAHCMTDDENFRYEEVA